MAYPRLAARPRLALGLAGVVLLLALAPAAAQQPRVGPGGAPPGGSGAVELDGFVRVIDGDTIEATIDGKRVGIGLSGVDAPPANTECGREAADRLRALVRGGGLRLDETAEAPFDGRRRRIYDVRARDGRSVAEEVAAAGVGRADGRGGARQRIAEAEAGARGARRGCLWSEARTGRQDDESSVDSPVAGPLFLAIDLGRGALVNPDARWAPSFAAAEAPVMAAAQPTTALAAGFAEEVVAAGLVEPTAIAWTPDGRLLVTEKRGRVRIYKNGALLPTPLVDIRDRVNDYWDRGLLGIAVARDFATSGHLYLLYTYENDPSEYEGPKTARLTRVTVAGDTAAPASEVVILGTRVGRSCNDLPTGVDCLPSDAESHSVGSVVVAPDGNLFVSAGDGASFNTVVDDAPRAQALDSLAGKVLRVSASGAGLTDNPFPGDPSANRSKVWASGLRNPYRLAIRPETGVPYLGDVGWSEWEEVDVAARGANLGWPCYEGGAVQAGYESHPDCQALYGRGPSAVRAPLVAWGHGGRSAAVTGGAFYTGTTFPTEYRGAYFYADYAQGWIRSLRVDAAERLVGSPSDFAANAGGPVAIATGPDGNLYYLAIVAGQVRRVRYVGGQTTTCPVGQYRAEYYANPGHAGTPGYQRCESAIDYDWGGGEPAPGIAADSFSVRWTGRHTFAAGEYTFTAVADDGVRVWVDGQLLIDEWQDQGTTTFRQTRALTAGEHEVRVEYYDNCCDAVARVGWQPAERPTTATVSFHAVGTNPHAVAVADVNGDGRRDVVAGNTGSNDVAVLLGNGDGTFRPALRSPAGPRVKFAAVGDFDGDGRPDLATANEDDSTVAILLGNGDGTFRAPRSFGACGRPHEVAVGDFNADGRRDLAVPCWDGTVVSVLLGNGDGTFRPKVDYQTGDGPHSAAVDDYNGDGRQDLAVASHDGDEVSVLLGRGDGTFQNKVDYPVDGSPHEVRAGDFNGDGRRDLVTANDVGNTVSVLLGNGDGTFRPAVRSIVGNAPMSVAVADFDGDGRLDLATADSGGYPSPTAPNGVTLLLGNGDGTFRFAGQVAAGAHPFSIVAADLGGSGRPELALANYSVGSNVAVLRDLFAGSPVPPNRPPTATIASPAATTTFAVSDTIAYNGSATDPDGDLVTLEWRIVLRHCPNFGTDCHVHPFRSSTGPSGSFAVPDHGDGTLFELQLTATDSRGIQSEPASVTIRPRTARVTLTTAPAGLELVYNGERAAAPLVRTAIVGSQVTIGAPAPQDGRTFQSWSDGGAQQHNVTVGASDVTYTATFSGGAPAPPVAPAPTSCSPRPPVTVQTAPAGPGRLQVTLRAGTSALLPDNRLRAIRLGAAANALVDVAGRTNLTGNVEVPLPADTRDLTFVVRRASPGAATTVPLVVVDACGDWPTFVGGGPTAF